MTKSTQLLLGDSDSDDFLGAGQHGQDSQEADTDFLGAGQLRLDLQEADTDFLGAGQLGQEADANFLDDHTDGAAPTVDLSSPSVSTTTTTTSTTQIRKTTTLTTRPTVDLSSVQDKKGEKRSRVYMLSKARETKKTKLEQLQKARNFRINGKT